MHATTHTPTHTHTHCKQSKRQVSSPRCPHAAPPSAQPSRGPSPEQLGSTERQLHRLRTHGLHPVSQDALSRRYTPVERRAHQHMAEQTSARCTRPTPVPSTPTGSTRAHRLDDGRSPPPRRAWSLATPDYSFNVDVWSFQRRRAPARHRTAPRPRGWHTDAIVCVDCLFLRSPSRVPYRTELIPRAPKGRRTRTPHP